MNLVEISIIDAWNHEMVMRDSHKHKAATPFGITIQITPPSAMSIIVDKLRETYNKINPPITEANIGQASAERNTLDIIPKNDVSEGTDIMEWLQEVAEHLVKNLAPDIAITMPQEDDDKIDFRAYFSESKEPKGDPDPDKSSQRSRSNSRPK